MCTNNKRLHKYIYIYQNCKHLNNLNVRCFEKQRDQSMWRTWSPSAGRRSNCSSKHDALFMNDAAVCLGRGERMQL